jgi:hypothetical protein
MGVADDLILRLEDEEAVKTSEGLESLGSVAVADSGVDGGRGRLFFSVTAEALPTSEEMRFGAVQVPLSRRLALVNGSSLVQLLSGSVATCSIDCDADASAGGVSDPS